MDTNNSEQNTPCKKQLNLHGVFLLFKRIICYDQMLCASVVAAADIVGVLLVKSLDIEALAVEVFNEGRVLDDKQELGFGFAQTHGQSCLVQLGESIALIVGKFRIIRGIQEHKIVLCQLLLCKEILKIHTLNVCVRKDLLRFIPEQSLHLVHKILFVVAHAAVGNVEFSMGIITEHRTVAIFPNEVKNSAAITFRRCVHSA